MNDWYRLHYLMKKYGWHPGRTDDDLLEILDKKIEELHRDAARYQWMIKNATWYRESDDAIMAFRVAKKSNLSCVAMRQLAIDAAIQEST